MNLYMLGNGGYAYELFDQLFLEKNSYKFQGFIILKDDEAFVINEEGIIPFNYQNDAAFVLATQNPIWRLKLLKHFIKHYDSTKTHFPNIYSNKAHVSKTSVIGIGNVFSAFSTISGVATVGNFNLFNSHSSVRSNCKIGNHNILHPYAGIMNSCIIGDYNVLQPNCVLTEKIIAGSDNVISAGECVFDNLNNEELFQSGIILKKEK